MDKGKLISVLEGYMNDLESRRVKPNQATDYDALLSDLPDSTATSHARWMCTEAIKLARADKIEKAMRWLGCIQGILWTSNCYTLNDLKEHSRPRCPHCRGPKGECEELHNHNIDMHDGDVLCKNTGKFIRYYDAG